MSALLPAVLVIISGALSLADEPAKPRVKDANARLRSKNAVLTTSVEPADAKPGSVVTFKITAKLDAGYHIYSYKKEKRKGLGPVNTHFDFFDTAGLAPEGEWTPSREPQKHNDSNFDNIEVEYYEDDVTWSMKLRVPDNAAAGPKALRVQASYMVCDAKGCSFPGQWTLPEATVTITDGADQPKQASATPPAAKTATPAAPPPAPVTIVNPAAAPASAIPAAATPTPAPPASKVAAEPAAASTTPLATAAKPAPGAATTESPKVESEIARKARAEGLIPFLLASAIGGVFALLMPCVWPMVPITVNFFVKQGQAGKAGRRKTTGLAITYCLAIIGIFTSVGVLFSFFFSASALQRLANNPWINISVAGLFLAFGLSLLGLFEIRLPSSLLNASAHGESRGGLIGVIFMALTLTITSFTCTFPVVGGLLVMAAGGDFLYPIIGLATFSAVLALPFFLLALSPGLLAQMPRSGDWMNSVKIVGGLVEIGAALKFINTAELAFVTPENAWFDAQVILTCWVVLATVCGLYLLGIFRTDHDLDEIKVGPVRMMSAVLFLGLALFMAPALFHQVPESRVWNRLIVGLLPPDAIEFTANRTAVAATSGSAEGGGEIKATSADPAKAEREEKRVHGVQWGMSFAEAKERAKAASKPILIDFTGVNCSNCRQMEFGVFPKKEVARLLEKFVTVQLYTDIVPIDSITADQRLKLAELNQNLLLDLAQDSTNPFYVVLSPEGAVLERIGGYNEPSVFIDFLNKALEKVSASTQVAQSGKARATAN